MRDAKLSSFFVKGKPKRKKIVQLEIKCELRKGKERRAEVVDINWLSTKKE